MRGTRSQESQEEAGLVPVYDVCDGRSGCWRFSRESLSEVERLRLLYQVEMSVPAV